ncbi:MAG: ergothioneine biosynthesis protein EgtB [Candidatus Tectomicrobia bacterium]|nr:ergothioneine biosynthesis protein EgtB [Candidatus Tectomicrobia bacterium]
MNVATDLIESLSEARGRSLDLVAHLSDEQLMGPKLDIVNPFRWEIGHVAWFQEKWILRHLRGEAAPRGDSDSLYDSIAIPHDTRWDLPLPSRAETLRYMEEVLERILAHLRRGACSDEAVYFHRLVLFHEDMHAEAFTYMLQTLAYPEPKLAAPANERGGAESSSAGQGQADESCRGDVDVPGGVFMLGGTPDLPFVFDNEKWAHPVPIEPFAISRTAVTNAEFRAFVEAGGYRRRELWSDVGWAWRQAAGAEHPIYWRRAADGGWGVRRYDREAPLLDWHPVIHVCWYEAEAYCAWAGRRLPSEAEWELAACGEPRPGGGFSRRKRRFPWGDQPPTPRRANLDARRAGTVDARALPAGDSAFGCRQMLGNIWEWTSSVFGPYPGFVPDPYKEYSEPWFGSRRVLRGGCWATRARMIRNTWRNFFTPDRRDVFAGFRTCAR